MAGGEYASGMISRTYIQGQTMLVKVMITVSHRGYFEFHICPNNNTSKPITEDCLNKLPLRIGNGSFRYREGGRGARMHKIQVKLPVDITCSQCVLRWKYITGIFLFSIQSQVKSVYCFKKYTKSQFQYFIFHNVVLHIVFCCLISCFHCKLFLDTRAIFYIYIYSYRQ
ncbi:hypothetical protein FSP39_013210 [Pinctada imbricata]|uniref:Chitin-binding type-4 domain-containing protein n=1 Tax=Pinctada imbricata TaxID=66713 RepID=A0AA89BVU0_PINIB|nr:hypothetical protein FSP39_013210 [Pinctada imbricata]